jgi:hypothetical protein
VPTPAGPGGSPGALWAAAAEDEAAAVEAFRTLAHRLDRVGAPAALVARCRVAAADEVRHARRCRSLAGLVGIDAAAAPRPPTSGPPTSGPGPRTGRGTELVRLAVESFVDGMLGEGAAAGRLERSAATAPDRAGVLGAIARDERSHAALGADIVRWCATQRPVVVPAALRAVARRVPERTALPAAHAAVPAADLRAAGLVDPAGAAAVWAAERERAAAVLASVLAQGRGRGPAQ